MTVRPTSPRDDLEPSTAVFDLDGTLYRENTMYAFLEQYHEQRPGGWSIVFRSARTRPGHVAWRLAERITGRDAFRAAALRSLRGAHEADVLALVTSYVEHLGAKAIPVVMERLEVERAAGRKLVLASASLEPVARAVARQLGMDGCVASRPQAHAGRYTGTWADDVRGRKLDALRRAYPDLRAFSVVTDNPDDLDLIEAAAHATVVVSDAHGARHWANAGAKVETLQVGT